MSKAIRDWCVGRKIYPNIFFNKVSNVGVFSISQVEAEIHLQLEPLEKLCLKMLISFKKVTRIEVHVFSGMSLSICESALQKLESIELIEIVDYDDNMLSENLSRLENESGSDWRMSEITELLKRTFIKQFRITKSGLQSIKDEGKTVVDLVDLNIMITGNPFYVFIDKVRLKPQGFDELPMSSDLTFTVLNLVKSIQERSGITPISITNHSISQGREVVTSNYWIAVENLNRKKDHNRFHTFLSSNSFDRWVRPPWHDDFSNYLPEFDETINIVHKSLESTFDMVGDVISEGLSLNKDKISWTLKSDLEMLLLINSVKPELIKEIEPEIRLKIADYPWFLILILKLDSFDDLSDQALIAARFHANITRKGFNLDKGYKTWQKIFNKWKKKTSYTKYENTLKLLVEHDCLTERLPDISMIYIDLDAFLSYNKRGSQEWNFSRIRQLDKLLDKASITNRTYLASSDFHNKIDEEDIATQWEKDHNLEIIDRDWEIHPGIVSAAQENCYYLGNRNIPSSDEYKELRRHSRNIKFHFDKKTLLIRGIEPFYDFKNENVIDKLYILHYE